MTKKCMFCNGQEDKWHEMVHVKYDLYRCKDAASCLANIEMTDWARANDCLYKEEEVSNG